MFENADGHALVWIALAVLSVVVFVGSFFLLHRVLIRLPAGYFSALHREERCGRTGPLTRIGKNLGGLVLIGAGTILLFTPGQGVLTILIGITLVDFPGKFQLERWLIGRPRVLSTINTWRERAARPALFVDE